MTRPAPNQTQLCTPHTKRRAIVGHFWTALIVAAGLSVSACRSVGPDGPIEPGTGGVDGAATPPSNSPNDPPSSGGGGGSGIAPTGQRFIGRVPTDSNTLSWSGSAVELAFNGTQGSIEFTALNGNNYVGLSVDGSNITRTFVQTSASIAFGPLPSGAHLVRATKLNEARLGEMVFNSFSFDGVASPSAGGGRSIEFIGDSITAAYGINGTTSSCTNTAALEDATQSYAALAAQALSSDASLIAWAGKGMVRNDTSDLSTAPVVMPNLWTRYIAADANSTYLFAAHTAPQVVVIALGTNDYEYTGADANTRIRASLDQNAFIAGYASFIQTVQTRYPAAKFVLCSSPMLSDSYPKAIDMQHTSLRDNLAAVASRFSSTTVAVVDFPTLTPSQATGCGGHPNIAGHAAMAQILIPQIKALMGW